MRKSALIAICSIVFGVYGIGSTAEPAPKETPVRSNAGKGEVNQFLSDMSDWVDSRLALLDPDKTRYLLARMGCAPKSGGIGDAHDRKVKEQTPTLEDDIGECKRKKANYYCLATTKLVEDFRVAENKYYAYCEGTR